MNGPPSRVEAFQSAMGTHLARSHLSKGSLPDGGVKNFMGTTFSGQACKNDESWNNRLAEGPEVKVIYLGGQQCGAADISCGLKSPFLVAGR